MFKRFKLPVQGILFLYFTLYTCFLSCSTGPALVSQTSVAYSSPKSEGIEEIDLSLSRLTPVQNEKVFPLPASSFDSLFFSSWGRMDVPILSLPESVFPVPLIEESVEISLPIPRILTSSFPNWALPRVPALSAETDSKKSGERAAAAPLPGGRSGSISPPAELPQTEKRIESAPSVEPLSRITAEVGKTIRIILPGIGWIFLGEKESPGKVRYLGKEVSDDTTSFSFSVSAAGETQLQFQKQDLIAKKISYESVIVSAGVERDPKQAVPTESAPQEKALAQSDEEKSAGVKEAGIKETDLDHIERLLQEGNLEEAVKALDQYLASEPGKQLRNFDAWCFTLANLYETEPKVKDIKKAFYYYNKICENYPLSAYWEEANRRRKYIQQNFFDIR
jgi:soluble cytochrome b562